MPARATSSGTISFGLVSIPVKVYTATRSKSVSFNMLHAKDRSRLKQQYVCATCGEKVERDATVRGYEYARDQYVVLTEEELKALESKSDKAIEIEEFLPIEKVDPIYFERSQLLGPDKGGQKAYRLLNEAMVTMGRVAIGRYRTRGREQLVLIRPRGRGLVLHGLFYADEVASFEDVEFGDEVELRARQVRGSLPPGSARRGRPEGRGTGGRDRGAAAGARADHRPDGGAQAQHRGAHRGGGRRRRSTTRSWNENA
jgi:DNA end-binding protein Ku